ncbi:MAG: tetratricopeptide repeat protein [Alphaproteobacteria bacterium]
MQTLWRHIKKQQSCSEKTEISLKEASTLRAIARIQMKNKEYDEAHDVLERCRDLYRENGDLLGEASALSAIGCLRYIIRDIANARKALMKSVYLYGKVSHHYAEAESLLYLARSRSV